MIIITGFYMYSQQLKRPTYLCIKIRAKYHNIINFDVTANNNSDTNGDD